MKSLSQMTGEELKTLCKSLEERYSENSTVTIKQSDFNNMLASIDRYIKENKRLQEQLKEANKIIKDYDTLREGYAYNPGDIYLKKWSLK